MFKDLTPRGVYYAVASLGGLFMIVVGLFLSLQVVFSNFVFKSHPKVNPMMYSMPPMPYEIKGIDGINARQDISKADKETISQWLKSYESWKWEVETQKNTPVVESMEVGAKQSLSAGLSMLLIGIPIFLYHIRFVLRDEKKS
jgi:hypothetical protein